MKICIASPSFEIYSETFIRTHIEKLPFDVVALNGKNLDRSAGESLVRESRIQRLRNYPSRKLRRFDARKFVWDRQASWLTRERVEVLLAEYGTVGARLVPCCEKAGVPMVVHFHGYDAHDDNFVSPILEDYRNLFHYASAIIGVSQVMIKRLVSLGAPKEKLHYIPYFVDPTRFQIADLKDVPGKVLSVGRFVEKKAPHLTILAFAKTLKNFPGARLEMAGDGPLLGPCKWLVKSLGIEKAVTFHGQKSHDWVASAMQRVRGFVQHSVVACSGDSEGTPVAVLEAQCSGLPVIATRHAGIADVVVHGETGFLCEEGGIDEMSEHLNQLFGMRGEDLCKMGLECRQRITNHFGRAETIDKLAEVMRAVAK